MKRSLFLLLFLITILSGSLTVHAQETLGCSTVTEYNYTGCCSEGRGDPGQPNGYACFVYEGGTQYQNTSGTTTTTTTTSSSGGATGGQTKAGATEGTQEPVIRGGSTQNTTPINNSSPKTTSTTTTVASYNACSDIRFDSFINILLWIKCVVAQILIPLMFSLAFLFFLWGVFKFMRSSDNKDKEDSKKYIWYGLIGLFVMVTVWGIIKIAAGVFGLEQGLPYLQTKYIDQSTTTPK